VDWWWIAFTAAAAGCVLGLVLGNRLLAAGAAIANLGLIGYDAFVLVDRDEWFTGHLSVFAYGHPSAFPVGKEWVAAACVLALATAGAPLRRLPLASLPLALVATLALVALSRDLPGGFFFLLWLLAAIVALAIAFGGLAPRLTVLAVGGVLAALSGVVEYFTERPFHSHPSVMWTVAGGLALGLLMPLVRLTRRRLT
jgi:hypothetical protein